MTWKDRFLHHLEQIAFFLEYHEENPFKIRAFSNALAVLEGVEESHLKEEIKSGRLTDRKGIGKGLLQVAQDFLKDGSSRELDTARGSIPAEILDLRQVKGLGVKKIKVLYEGLQIKTLGELEYACNENRLISLPGFGSKTQEKIVAEISKIKARSTFCLLSDALERDREIQKILKPLKTPLIPLGDLARKSEIVSQLEYLVEAPKAQVIFDTLSQLRSISDLALDKAESKIHFKVKGLSDVSLYCRSQQDCEPFEIFKTSSPEHWQALEAFAKKKNYNLTPQGLLRGHEKVHPRSNIYEAIQLNFYPPESREIPPSLSSSWRPLLESQIIGGFHLHTQDSDGMNSLSEMVEAAKSMGWSYFGVSEHSQTASYAQGLNEERLLTQWKEIDSLNQKNASSFKIFRGIESDILKDGKLDYPTSVLKKFDFIIASIHTRYGMTEMTDRLIAAIENPLTTMIGHISGRLLLARDPYAFDKKKVLDAAISNRVVIEFNSNPHRLDLDWRDLAEACQRGLLVSLNPDAHSCEGLKDIQYGIWFANKARIPHELILNTWNMDKIERFLNEK